MTDGQERSRRLQFGDYELVKRRGRGAYGAVWKARDLTLDGRIVAIKILHRDYSDDPDWVRRFKREAAIAANLVHPNIPTIYRVGIHDGSHFIAMTFIDGETLVESSGRISHPVPVSWVAEMLGPVASALDFAHERDVVHGDVKPSNIMVDATGKAWIIDFGLALPNKVEADLTTNTVGFRPYLSPERLRGGPRTASSDRYALGVVAYELLAKQWPYPHFSSDEEMLRRMRMDPARPVCEHCPEVPKETSDAITRMISPHPGDRFTTCKDFVRLLCPPHDPSIHPVDLPRLSEPDMDGVHVSPTKPVNMPPPGNATRRGIMIVGVTGLGSLGLGYLLTGYALGTSEFMQTLQTPSPTAPALKARVPVALPVLPTEVRAIPAPTGMPPTPTRVQPTSTAFGPKRLIVDQYGGGEFRSIQSAIDESKRGDIIVLRPGSYRESLTLTRDVEIRGDGGRSKVRVEAESRTVFTVTGGSAVLSGMTISVGGFGGLSPSAVDVRSGTPVIKDCDLVSVPGNAVTISGASSNPVFRNSTIHSSRYAGVLVQQMGKGTFELCEISDNNVAGIETTTGGNPVVRSCEITGNRLGIYIHDGGRGMFDANELSGNAFGPWIISPDAGSFSREGNIPNM